MTLVLFIMGSFNISCRLCAKSFFDSKIKKFFTNVEPMLAISYTCGLWSCHLMIRSSVRFRFFEFSGSTKPNSKSLYFRARALLELIYKKTEKKSNIVMSKIPVDVSYYCVQMSIGFNI
jgi:hypothetical protein